MNNPDSNFLSPLRTQPQKKQRGGSTPRSISSRTRESGASQSQSQPQPQAQAQSQSLSVDREVPVPLPTATSVDPMTEGAGDAIARRRAELRRLQAQRESRALKRPDAVTPSMALQSVTLSQGANGTGNAPPTATSNTTANVKVGPPPPTPTIPKPGEHVARHHSDLFPTVQKSPGTNKAAVPPLARPVPSIPPVHLTETGNGTISSQPSTSMSTSTKPPKAPSSGSAPPPPPVNRKLEFARAKSAPPARPPPPPPKGLQMSQQAKEAPPTTTTSSVPANKDRRPPPVMPATLLLDPGPTPTTRNQDGSSTIQQPSAPPSIAVGGPVPVASTPHKLEESKPPIPETKTPAPVQTPLILPPTTTRRDRIKSIRDGLADTNATDPTSSKESMVRLHSETAARLEQSLKETMEERKKALERIVELEKALDEAKEETMRAKQTVLPTTPQPKSLQKMLLISETEGEQAALQWARAQVVGVPPLSNESLVASPGRRLLDVSHSSFATRAVAPQPKLLTDDLQEPKNMVLLERQLITHFREAANCVPFQFDSPLATFIVRRPYGIETEPELFASCSLMDHPQYSRKAHVSTISTLEVAAIVKANQSQFNLSDQTNIRYQVNDEWKAVANIEQLDRPLGTLTYIDNEGMERDYSLDQLLEEAQLVREQYCRTITSTALGFKNRPIPEPTLVEEPVIEKPTTSSIAVDTSDIPFPPATIDVPKKEEEKTAPATKTSPVPEESAASTGDLFAIFIGMLVSNLVRFVTYLLIGLPLAIVRTTVVSAMTIAILSVAYLYLLQEYHNGHSISLLDTTGYHSNNFNLNIL